jgi:mono/diheme cytochrome c family protein
MAAGLGLAALAGACVQTPVISGKAVYEENCVMCHGPGGQGDGQLSDSLFKMPPDLTELSQRNGGVFPRNAVISTIDGYARGEHFSGAMPEFGVKLAGESVLLETGEGVVTPTPEPLVALAEYLEAIQK